MNRLRVVVRSVVRDGNLVKGLTLMTKRYRETSDLIPSPEDLSIVPKGERAVHAILFAMLAEMRALPTEVLKTQGCEVDFEVEGPLHEADLSDVQQAFLLFTRKGYHIYYRNVLLGEEQLLWKDLCKVVGDEDDGWEKVTIKIP